MSLAILTTQYKPTPALNKRGFIQEHRLAANHGLVAANLLLRTRLTDQTAP